MARTANPNTQVAKRIKALQIKANKLNDEITALADFVANESQKPTKQKAKPIAKKASAPKAKKTIAKAKTAPKKATSPKSNKSRGTVKPVSKAKATPVASKPRAKAKGKEPAKVDYLSMLND